MESEAHGPWERRHLSTRRVTPQEGEETMSESAERPAMPPQMLLYQMAIGHYLSRALHVIAKLGVADLLSDGAPGDEELAKATQAHPQALRRGKPLPASVPLVQAEAHA